MPDWIPLFFATFLGQSLSFVAVVSLVFLLTWRWGAKRLAGRRIHGRGRPFDGAQLRHELLNTLAVLAVGAAQGLVLSALHARGLTRLTEELGAGGLLGAAATLVGLIVFNDLWFYSVHRALHTPWLFKHVHAVHHRSVDVNPFSSYSFHVVEGALLGGWVIPAGPAPPPAHPHAGRRPRRRHLQQRHGAPRLRAAPGLVDPRPAAALVQHRHLS
ncbi:MAG: sterol desaturase family protein [Deltaproteobacteria bacterium]|nr:sterol desaturase family protein [Deltaproteobacteria bacterium]